MPAPRRRSSMVLKLALVLGLLGLLFAGSGVAVAFGTYNYYAQQLEGQLDRLKTRSVFETTRIYDRNGYLLYEVFGEGKRTKLDSLSQVPPDLVSATLAIEDKTFYENPGVDPAGITRAAVLFLTTGEIRGGGSTLTQQLIRNTLFDIQERYANTLDRKIKEAILALEMTRTYSKDDILLMYLNEVPYGNLSYGIEAAAEGYFGKHALDLDLAQCAFLAGMPQSPTEYNPFFEGGMDKSKARQYDVLQLMVENGYITQKQADAAYDEPLSFTRQEAQLEAPHFALWVRQLLEQDPDIGPDKVYNGGLSVYTSLDMRYQRLAEAVVRDRMLPDPNDPKKNEDVFYMNSNNAAMVVMKPSTGEILAMVGSVDYNMVKPSRCGVDGNVVDGNVNAALADRQPGSSFKTITYLTAFTKGWSPATMILDMPTTFPVPGQEPYEPRNYTRKWYGPLRARVALDCSLNMPAVKTIQFAGVDSVIDMAHRLGVTGLNRGLEYYGLSLTLGGGEVSLLDMVTANSTYANEGRYVAPVAILKVVDANGNVLKEYKPKPLDEQPEVVDPRYIYLLENVLSDDSAREMTFGRGGVLVLSRPAGVKTGTSEDWSDGWTIGFTPYLAAGVWVGNNNNEPMAPNCQPAGSTTSGMTGVSTAGRMWHNFMEAIFHPDDPNRGLARFFPDEEQRSAWFKNADMEDILRDKDGDLQIDFRRPRGIVDVDVCAVSGLLPGPNCPIAHEVFAEGNEPHAPCNVHKTVTVVQFPGSNPPVYCLPVPGVAYPPELVQQQTFMDLESVAKPEELAGVQQWMQDTGTPRMPTAYCPADLGTLPPSNPDQPPPKQSDWSGLVREITSPMRYAGISGPVNIMGSADLVSAIPADQFAYYIVEWGQKGPMGELPTAWYNVAPDVGRTPVHNGVLAAWDPGGLPDGGYVLRLTVVTQDGRPHSEAEQPGHTYVPIYLDRGPIYIRLLSPTAGSTLNQSSVTLSAKVEGVSPARRVDFFYDGVFIGSAITSTVMPLSERVYTVTWTVRSGQHRLTAEATNTAGKHGVSQSVLIVGNPPEGNLPAGVGRAVAAVALPATGIAQDGLARTVAVLPLLPELKRLKQD